MIRQSVASLHGASRQVTRARSGQAAAFATAPPSSSSSGLPTAPPSDEPSGLPSLPPSDKEEPHEQSPEDKGRSQAIAMRKRNELRQLEHLPSQKKAQVIEHGVPTYHFNPPNAFYNELNPDHETWRRTTALEISHRRDPPMRVKMLVRDFIDDSLYNPSYGYFSNPNLSIFTTATEKGYDFSTFRSADHFSHAVGERYEEYLRIEEEQWQQDGDVDRKGTKEVWHTPGELFKPWYGRAIARCLVSDYKLRHYPYEDLIIYEMGAGNGTLMACILNFIRKEHPDVYERTSYRIIEISEPLSEKQKAVARKHHHLKVVEIVNQSIFDWEERVMEPCAFIAMEVLDNFAHDMIRFNLQTGEPVQGIVIIDDAGDFQLVYEPVTDPLIQQFLDLRALLPAPLNQSPAFPAWFAESPTLRSLRLQLPFAPNLSKAEYLPTKALLFMEALRDKFPQHRLLMSDFDALPDAIEGHTAPVVQTRWKNTSVPVSTFMVRQGFFDIFFPTDFKLFRSLYALVQNLPSSLPASRLRISPASSSSSLPHPSGHLPPDFFSPNASTELPLLPSPSELKNPAIRQGDEKIRIYKHEDFLRAYGADDVAKTQVKDGTNVMLKWFQNVSFLF